MRTSVIAIDISAGKGKKGLVFSGVARLFRMGAVFCIKAFPLVPVHHNVDKKD
jgi:hypothetical protein